MTDPPSTQAVTPHDAMRGMTRTLLTSWMLIVLGLMLLAAAEWDYLMVKQDAFLRTECLVAGIAAGIGAAFCFGGAMHLLKRHSMALPGSSWRWRWFAAIQQRLLLVAQLLAMGLAVGATLLWVLEKPIPVGDSPPLHQSWGATDTPVD